ncbi:MAG: hypothetical protein PF692_03160 [Kiritimatiellae bacterium]|jgi:hypothetical protein|nr:hypothetical protein [Kiritimatiellia bacterium]
MNMYNKKFRAALAILLFLLNGIFCAYSAGLNEDNIIKPYVGKLTTVEIDRSSLGVMGKYVTEMVEDDSGQIIVKVVVPGVPPKERISQDVITRFSGSDVIVSNVPAFNWTYGCSATSAGMLCGYYDRTGYSNLYTGSINGGVCPLDNSAWGAATAPGSDGECSFVASHQGIDGRTTRGHVDDYWTDYNDTGDPYYGKWTPHNAVDSGDCLADFMGTSQWYPVELNNIDGGTSFAYYLDGSSYSGITFGDLAYGVQRYIRHQGYSVSTYYNQLIYGYNGNTEGFTFEQYMDSIDAGNPVFIHVTGHTMLGVGYDVATSNVYLHDTWNYDQHSMTWGGQYSSMTHVAVTVVNIDSTIPLDVPTNFQATSGTYSDSVVLSWDSVPGANHYKIYYGDSLGNRQGSTGWFASNPVNIGEDPSSTYYYWVVAASSAAGANESDFSLGATGYAITKMVYNDWIATNSVPIGEQAWDDDPAGDGIENIWKYAMELDPLTFSAWSNVFEYAINNYDEEFYITFDKAKVADVTITPEWKSSLLDSEWMPTNMVSQLLEADSTSEKWRFGIPFYTNGFIRLKVSMEQ